MQNNILSGLEKNASTIGAIALPALADIMTGGLAIPADVALSGLGAAGGQALSNVAQGKKALSMSDLTAGLSGAAGGAMGAGLSTVIGKGVKMLGEAAEKAAAKDIVPVTPADQAVTKNAIYGEAMGAKNAPFLRNGFQSTLNNAENLGVNTLDRNAPSLMSKIGKSVTGGNLDSKGFLNDTVDSLLQKHGGSLNLAGDKYGDSLFSNLEQSAQAQNARGFNVGNLADTIVKGKKVTPTNNIVQQFAKQLDAMSPKVQSKTGTDLVVQPMSTSEGDSLAKKLANIAFDNSPLPKDPMKADSVIAQRNMARDLFGYVRGMVDRQPALDSAVKNLANDPQLSAKIDAAVANIPDANIRNSVKNDMLDSLSNANTIQDLRAAQAKYVDMSKLGEHVNTHLSEKTYTPGQVKLAKSEEPVAAPTKKTRGTLASTVKGLRAGAALTGISDPNQPAWARTLEVAQELPALAENPQLLKGGGRFLSLLGRLSPAAGAGVGAQTANELRQNQQGVQTPSMNLASYTVPTGGSAPTAAATPQTSLTPLELQAVMGVIGSMSPYSAAQYVPMAQTGLSGIQTVQKAQTALQQAEQEAMAAGGGQGRLPGILSYLGGQITGGPALQYQRAEQQLAPLLKAAGVSDVMPTLTESPLAMREAFAQQQALLSSLI